MLLRFSVANHLSLKEPQALALTASPLKDVEDGLIESAAVPDGRVLPAVVIYGANASGKSNVVAALRFMQQAVLASHRRGEPGGGVRRTPFALDPACAKSPSVFTADFIAEGVRYHYGFEASDEAFTTEWLYSFPSGRRQTLFERDGKQFIFGRSLKGRNRIIADLTRPNSLYVSAAAQNDHGQLSKIVDFFGVIDSDSVISVSSAAISEILAFLNKLQNENDPIIKFLDDIGTGVTNFRWLEKEVPSKVRMARLLSGLHKTDAIVELAHRGRQGETVFFDLDRESAGTRRLLILLGKAFRALDEGTLLVIDELDASLHTKACEAVLALFCSSKTNPKGAQLIATTHDTNLLRSPLLRRDQIWFTEKDSEGGTHLFPLTDIRTRKGDNIEKGYLQGRYGAIPFSGPISDLIHAA